METNKSRRLAATLGALLSLTIIASASLTAQAQDMGIITPTAAPTKTGVPTTPMPEATPEPTEASVSDARRDSLTQADLSVLTGNVQRPNGMIWHDGNLYVSCTGDWTLYQLNTLTGQTRTYIYGVRNAHTLYAETDDAGELNLWVPDYQNNRIARVTRMGVNAVVSNLSGPWGISYLNENEFLVTNLLGNNISLVNRDGDQRQLVANLMAPAGLVQDGENIYVANNGSTRRAIEWYSMDVLTDEQPLDATAEPGAHSLVTGLQNPTGLTLAPDGYLYVAFSLGTRGVIGRVHPGECRENGGCTPEQVEIVVLTELAAPLAGLTISPDMRLYVHTMFSPDIYWVQLDAGE